MSKASLGQTDEGHGFQNFAGDNYPVLIKTFLNVQIQTVWCLPQLKIKIRMFYKPHNLLTDHAWSVDRKTGAPG